MGRIQTAFVSGTILNNPLAIGDTSLSSAGLSTLSVITSPDIAAVILDPGGVAGAPEVVWVTAHTAAATTATIARGKEGSSARQHLVGTPWVHGPTLLDYEAAIPEYLEPQLQYNVTFANGLTGANIAFLTPMIPLTADVTITQLIGSIGVQNGNVDVGVYEWDGTTMTRVVSLGSTACPAAATRVAYNITDTPLYKGTRYFFALASDSASATFGATTGPALVVPSAACYTKAASFPLPATIASLSASSGAVLLYGTVTGGIAL